MKAALQGLDEQASPVIRDATHLIVDVGEADFMLVVGEGQFTTGARMAEAPRSEQGNVRR